MYLLDGHPQLAARLRELAGLRAVFFAGLPGTGKSLMVHQLAHLAHQAGREVHLLQWDVARPPFEASEVAAPYRPVQGASHPLIRRAVGLWARAQLARWHAVQPATSLLIGETPFIGNRFIELTQPCADAAEALLASDACRFVLSVPTEAVRRHIVAERERRAVAPLHAREREDASPPVMHGAWQELVEVARAAGLVATGAQYPTYDPDVYEAVYRQLAGVRRLQLLVQEAVLPTSQLSVYEIGVPVHDVLPDPGEAKSFIRQAESEAG